MDFNIRQLYYPYRSICDSTNKEIICLFITKDKFNIIHVFSFVFAKLLEINSIECVNYHKYIF